MEIAREKIDALYERLNREAEESGYHLNPDTAFTKDLVQGLIVNEQRYGYWACPCRLASGNKLDDADVVCPCNYRDPDLTEHGMCYCGLYVSADVKEGRKSISPIPERRPEKEKRRQYVQSNTPSGSNIPVWRCSVCGYLCAREGPPEVCPICKAKKDRFESFPLPKQGE